MGKMGSINPKFKLLSDSDKLKTILCPKSTPEVKIVNKFIRIMFLARDNLSEGSSIDNLSYPTMPVHVYPADTDYENFSETDEWEISFSSEASDTND